MDNFATSEVEEFSEGSTIDWMLASEIFTTPVLWDRNYKAVKKTFNIAQFFDDLAKKINDFFSSKSLPQTIEVTGKHCCKKTVFIICYYV